MFVYLLQAGKEYVVGQILDILQDLIWILENKEPLDQNGEELEDPGHFISNMDKVQQIPALRSPPPKLMPYS